MMKLGIMGGTFNPPHNGHLQAADHVRQALGLDRVYFMPVNIPPHKTMPAGSASSRQRCEMVQLMIADKPWAELCRLEVEREGPSYTVDTLRWLHRQARYESISLIVGTDMLINFPKWREPGEICRLAELAVVAREADERDVLERQAAELAELFSARVRLINSPALPVSSTQIRQEGAFYKWTPPQVAQYIEKNRLYR